MKLRRLAFAVVLISAVAPMSTKVFAQSTTSRLALVIGEAQYRDEPLATAANDGGLMADLLRQAGYDVTGAANLSQDQIRSSFREFLEKVAAAGPQAEVFVYLSGKGVQFAGENYLAPIEATIGNSANVPAEAVRLADFIGPLEGMPARARVVVLDLARPNNFGRTGQPLASGLAIVDAPENSLVAFNAAPGTIALDEKGPYGSYAQSLAEMLRQPGLPLNDAFAQVRLRVNEATRGGQTPWNVSKLTTAMALFAPAPGAPAIAPLARSRKPMREVSPQEAYGYAVEADTFAAYNDFLQAYPSDPLARRVRAMLAARREAITWRRTYVANTPEAYWTYLQRYSRGPHAADAQRRLAYLSAPVAPPRSFRVYEDYDVPPPPPDEITIIDRPRFYVNEVVDVPPPRYADDFLPPVPREYRDLPPPPPPPRAGFLPIPVPIPMPFGRQQGPQGVVVPPRFVEQPASAPGAGPGGAPGARRGPAAQSELPQGYSPAPQRPGPGAPGAAPPAAAPLPNGAAAPGRPGAAPMTGAPSRPAGAPGTPPAPQPGTDVPPAGSRAPQTTAPERTAPGAPSQVLPRPAGPAGERPEAHSGAGPAATPSQTLPQPRAPGAEQRTTRPGAETPNAPNAPAQTLPRPNGGPATGSPAAAPSARPSTTETPAHTPQRNAPAGGSDAAPGAETHTRPAAPAAPAAPPAAPRAAPAPERAPAAAPQREAPAQARPTPRSEPRSEVPGAGAPRPAAPEPRGEPPRATAPAPHMEAPRAAPPAPAAPHVDAPRAAPPAPHVDAPRPAAPAPHMDAPRPAAPAGMPHPAAPPAGAPRPGPAGERAPGSHGPGTGAAPENGR